MDREMNFWDLCVAIAHAIGRGCVWCWEVLTRMIRLTWRYWWLVLPIVALAIGAAVFHTRKDNICYKVNAVALLNGPSIQQFEQRYALLQSGALVPGDAAIMRFLVERQIEAFTTYRVVDCLNDGTADFVDFKRKSSPTDTVKVQMQDRLCIQFRTRAYTIGLIPEMEQALLEWLNSDEAMQQSYIGYLANLKEQVAFDHKQAQKLDSLTSAYYFNQGAVAEPTNKGVNFYGDRRIRLFLNEIYKQQEHMQLNDYRLQLATAPVTLENHFSVDPKPVHSRMHMVVLFFILGWLAGCVLAEIVDKRKAIYAWLKQ